MGGASWGAAMLAAAAVMVVSPSAATAESPSGGGEANVSSATGAASGEGARGDEEPAAPAAPTTTDGPTVGAAFRDIVSWLGDWSAPDTGAWDAQPEWTSGVAVTIRLDNELLARSTVLQEEVDSDDPAVLVASRKAIGAASRRITQRLPAGVDAEQVRREALARITLDVQFAGELVPLRLPNAAAADVLVNAGLDGVAARLGDRVEVSFPATQLIAGHTPSDAVRTLLGRLRLPFAPLDQLRASHDVRFYRFPVEHLAIVPGFRYPIELHRGGRVVRQQEITRATLVRTAEAMTAHLVGRLPMAGLGQAGIVLDGVDERVNGGDDASGGDENVARAIGLMGPYFAPQDRYESMSIEPLAEAIAAFALGRVDELRPMDASTIDRANAAAWHMLEALRSNGDAGRDGIGDEAVDRAAARGAEAAWLLAWSAVAATTPPAAVDRGPLDTHAEATLQRLALRLVDDATFDEALATSDALAAFAVAEAAPLLLPKPAGALEAADARVRLLFARTSTERLPALMPWLAWAELALHPADRRPADEGDEGSDAPGGAGDAGAYAVLPAELALLDLRELIERHMLTPADAGQLQPDLVGGVVFTEGPASLPTWHSLRVLGVLASAAGDPRLTPRDEFHRRAGVLSSGLRFAVNLTASPYEAHMYPVPRRAVGGMRLALWDNRVTVESTALGLLAIVEAVNATDRRLPAQRPTDRRTR